MDVKGMLAKIEKWLVTYFAERLGVEPGEIDISRPFVDYGLASVEGIALVRKLEAWLDISLSPTLAWDYPSIESLAKHLTNNLAAAEEKKTATTPITAGRVEPVAIIGMGCRFPGAQNPGAFWELLSNGVDAITEVPADRWNVDEFYSPDPSAPGKAVTRDGGFLEDVAGFDAAFFGISPREAAHVDPRQRLMLELAWEALEDANISPSSLAGSQTGVFIATLGSDYGTTLFSEYLDLTDAYSGPGNAHSVVANRVSYFLNTHGPSISLDTACSGALVALHLACQSLNSGESTLALVGGVNVSTRPDNHVFYSKAGAMAPDGRCKAFDSRADGMVRSDGAGIVVLKRLSEALVDGDHIWGVVRGSAVNQDGYSNGLMAPNGNAQQAVIQRAYEQAGISPGMVQYIEAHGTGTELGDPIEVNALTPVLSQDRPVGRQCALGSVKSNIGHTEAAAGMAGLIKVLLAMKHRRLPPSIHFENPNPLIDFDKTPLYVQNTLGPWPVETEPLVAGINSFGIGGSNAHVVVSEAPVSEMAGRAETADGKTKEASAYLLPLSARKEAALQALARSYRDFTADNPQTSLADICYTASTKRSHLEHRLACVVRSREELIEYLDTFLEGGSRAGLASGLKPFNQQRSKLAFIFSGQGSHWLSMGTALMKQDRTFRATLQQCDRLLQKLVDWSLLEILADETVESRLNETDVAQPAIFAIQVALAALWHSWGITPDVIVGQSLGEVAAAHVSGALSLEDALRVVVHRSRLMKQVVGKGKTAVVALSPEQAELTITGFEDLVSVAGSNAPSTSVLSGDPEALERILKSLERRDIFCRFLKDVDIAFHSPQMDPLQQELVESLAGIEPQSTSVPVYSTVLNGQIDGSQFDAEYWGRNLREPFYFGKVVEQLIAEGVRNFLEVSPHPVLSTAIQESLAQGKNEGTVIASMQRQKDEWETILTALGTLFTLGYEIEWEHACHYEARQIALPSYPWQRKRYWIDQLRENGSAAGLKQQIRPRRNGVHPLLGEHFQLSSPAGYHVWETELGAHHTGFLSDHRVLGTVMLPAAAYLEMALAAARQAFGNGPLQIENVEFKHALYLPEEGVRQIQVIIAPESQQTASFQISSAPAVKDAPPAWTQHVTGQIRYGDQIVPITREKLPVSEIQTNYQELSPELHYETMANRGLQYGPHFQAVKKIWHLDDRALGRLRLSAPLNSSSNLYQIHPTLLDGGFQLVGTTVASAVNGNQPDVTFLPVGVERVEIHDRPGTELWCHTGLRLMTAPDSDTLVADVYLLNEEGEAVVTLSGLRLKDIESGPAGGQQELSDWLYEVEWRLEEKIEEAVTRPTGMALEALLQEVAGTAPAEAQGSWLIFADEGDVGRQLARLLSGHEERCVLVTKADAYHALSADHYQVNPDQAADFERLITDALPLEKPACRGVVYLWGLDSQLVEDGEMEQLDAIRQMNGHIVLHIMQVVAKAGFDELPRVWLVTQGAQPVTADQNKLSLSQSLLWGIGRVAAMELPEMWGGLVDLDPDEPAEADVLHSEIWDRHNEPQVAYRKQKRYVARLAHSQKDFKVSQPPRFRPDGSYLITGGFSGLGLAVAHWMVDNGAQRLILLGRTALPQRTEWYKVNGNERLASRIEAVRQLEAKGASVHTISADIGDEKQIEAFVTQYRLEAWPPIRGVVHSAGVTLDRLFVHMDEETFDTVLRPKLNGAWILHRLLADEPLDFFVMFSSATSMLGQFGQANYAAGNSFMDMLAHYRRAQGLPATSINWAGWAEIGMAVQTGSEESLTQNGMGLIQPQQGLEILSRLMQHHPTQIGVLPINWNEWRETKYPFYAEFEENLRAEGRAEEAEIDETILQELLLLGTEAARLNLIESHLKDKLGRIMRLEPDELIPTQPLDMLGMDSVMAVELKNNIEDKFGVPLSMVDLLQGSSISDLAGQILSRLNLEDATIALLLEQVEEMSLEQVAELLQE